MFIKDLTKVERLMKLEVLDSRILKAHPKVPEITQDLIKQRSGYKGERAVSYYLSFLPEKEFYIFHNLRLQMGKHYFQIDFLILTIHFALILECKNVFGELFFDSTFKQLIRTSNDQEEGFPDPISQVKWHQKKLCSWMESHHFSHFPIEILVVMSNPNAILRKDPDDKGITEMVVKSQNLLERIDEITQRHPTEAIDHKGMRKLCKTLLKSHTPEDIALLKYYGVHKSDIITGVQCPECQRFAMIRHKKKWFCEQCGSYSKNAHEKAIEDYLLLIQPTVSNKEFRDFTHLPSIYTANRQLNAMNLVQSGTNKGRRYSLKRE